MDALRPQDPAHIGAHALLARLGAGGMGQVYLGRSPGGRLVAIKVIREEITGHPEALTRFRREVETVRAVRSAYTANLIDASLSEPPYWLATEYVTGPTLSHAVGERGPFPADTCRGVFAALAEGLASVHTYGVTHRDLKPQNVILSAQGPQLIDFGIARGTGDAALTDTGFAPGTPGFAAPEVLMANQVGPAADVFALGATMAYAATGRAPFGGGQPAAVGYRVVHEEIDLAGVEPELAALIAWCVAKDPTARPPLVTVIERCGVRAALVDDGFYASLAAPGEAPPVPGLHGMPTATAGHPPAGYTPTRGAASPGPAAPARTARGFKPWLAAAVAVVAVGVGTVVAVQLASGGSKGSGPPRSKPSGSTRSPASSSAKQPAGAPRYIDTNRVSRDYWTHTVPGGKCNLPPEERALDGFMTSVGVGGGDPAERILTGKVRLGWRDKDPDPHPPYYVTVTVKPPDEIDADTGKPIAGLVQQNLEPGYASKPVDLYAGDATNWHYLTYPDDFTARFKDDISPAIPLLNDPGDWTVLFHHVETPEKYASIMCQGFRAK